MTEIEKLFSRRKATRGYLDRCAQAIKNESEKLEPDCDIINTHYELFRNKLEVLDRVQEEIETNAEDSNLDGLVDESFDYRTRLVQIKVLAEKHLATSPRPPAGDASPGQPEDIASFVSEGAFKPYNKAALPKINLPKFDGKNPTEWPSFYDQFNAVVHNSDLPDVSKFVYLRSLLKGEAGAVIEGLSLTKEHYAIALELLESRYGRREKLIFSHIQDLLAIEVPDAKSVNSLWSLQDKMLSNVRSLEKFGITGSQYGVILTPLVLSRLPQDLRMEWAKEEGKESDLEHLLNFLKKEIQRRERSLTFSTASFVSTGTSAQSQKRVANRGHATGGTATSLIVQQGVICVLCSKGHPTEKCWNWKKLTLDERHAKVKQLGLCFRCLNKNCFSKMCKRFCTNEGCENGRHHALLCKKKFGDKIVQSCQSGSQIKDSANDENPALALMSARSHHSSVFMQMAKVPVVTNTGKIEMANVLFDTGSNKTYVSSEFVRKINPKWEGCEPVSYVAFGSKETGPRTMRNIFTVQMLCFKDNTYKSITATEIPTICAPLFCPSISRKFMGSFSDLPLTNCFEGTRVSVDILIGLDSYWSCMMPGCVRAGNLVAQETLFGWVLSGTTPHVSSNDSSAVSTSLLSFNDISQTDLHKFWDLESIGILDCSKTTLDPVLTEFERTVSFSNGRYEVSLPWKPGKQSLLQNNEQSAGKRLENLSKRLKKNSQLEEGYHKYFQELESGEMIEEVHPEQIESPFPIFYLPHRPVVRTESLSTKIRPVFDASASGPNCVSLNDCLFSGPNLLPDLVEILIRFRRWPIAVTGDIQKAFLQIQLVKEDRDVHRFLLPKPDGKVRVMRFKRVTFGVNCSPFLLNAVIAHHLNKQEDGLVVRDLRDNLYVDDYLSGGDTSIEVCNMIRESTSILSSAGFTLGKWNSNDPLVGSMLVNEFTDKNLTGESAVKVLGIKWMAQDDSFSFDGINVPDGIVITKRVVLSYIARLFDPLGLVNPFVMTVKCLFQELWKLGLPWDDEIPDNLYSEFLNWCRGLERLKEWKIPRCYTQLPWKDIVVHELHAFGDASQKGYGACVYLVCIYNTGLRKSSLVISRARVAPLKIQTLPKLELLAALLCARLIKFVRLSLKLPSDTKLFCWTDSRVTLTWIKGEPHRWKTFIANRVMQIHELTDPATWRFVSGLQNPADLVTRGISAEELIDSHRWLQGPEFLTEASESLVESTAESCVGERFPCETEEEHVSLLSKVDSSSTPLFETDRWGSFEKAIRVVAWVLRFLRNARTACVNHTGELTLEELTEAKLKLLLCVQKQSYASELSCLLSGSSLSKISPIQRLNPFVDNEGLIRVGGRLHFSHLNFEEKHPVIMPKVHVSFLLVRNYHLMMKHAGVASLVAVVRRQYWIIGLRNLAKKVKKQCISCQRQDALACDQPTAPLPEDRVVRAPAFSTSGIDHAGPLFCSDFPKKKFYILLFTCGVVRAIHLELVDSLNVFDTSLAFRRFVARRGLPSIVYSDNAKSFVSVRKQLISYYGHLAPKWKMIAPRSPWWGGFYERLVRSVKSALRKSLGSNLITRSELETSLHEVEFCLNSRPLTFVGDSVESGYPLSPAHFLLERPMTVFPDLSSDITNLTQESLVAKNEFRNKIMEQFWVIWQHDYLQELPKSGDSNSRGELSVGSIVLVRESGVPRLKWPLGRVIKLFPGKDGKTRSVEIKTSKGSICRSVQLLHDLEILPETDIAREKTAFENKLDDVARVSGDGKALVKDHMSSSDTVIVEFPVARSRSGRLIKPREKLNL